jgi:T5SS/PEP-CTERM-associated repeat protein
MTQTNFTVTNNGSLTSALAAISNGGTDAAIDTAYTITLPTLVDAPSPPTPSATLSLPNGSSLLLTGVGGLQVASFLVNGGTVTAATDIAGMVSLDRAVLINTQNFTGGIVNATSNTVENLVNTGVIDQTGAAPAVEFEDGTVETGWNGASGAEILATGVGVALEAGGVLQNGGTIVASGANGFGVYIGAGGGTVSNGQPNDTTALISGGLYGAVIEGPGIVGNAGTITGTSGTGVYLFSGLITNGSQFDPAALIEGTSGDGVLVESGIGTIGNFGTIAGGGTAGIVLEVGGTVVNGAPLDTLARIAGYQDGVVIVGAGSVTNDGTIAVTQTTGSADIGVFLADGGGVTNAGTNAVIDGASWGVLAEGAGATVTNQGSIKASGAPGLGVDLAAGGTVINGSAVYGSALIAGSYDGVRILSDINDVVQNFGTIEGSVGVDFLSGASQAAGTLINAGLVDGTGGYAVEFGTGSETLVLEATGTIVGNVLGGDEGSTTLELANGTTGTLSAVAQTVGTVSDSAGSFSFMRVGLFTIDSGASWTVNSPAAFNTLTDSGTLSLDGNVTINSLDIAGGLLMLSGQTLSMNTVTIDAQGNITGFGTVTGTVSNIGTITANGGTLVLTGTVTGIGSLVVDPGSALQLDLGGGAGAVTVKDGSLAANGLLAVQQTGFGGLLVENQATVTTGISAVAGAQGLDIAPTAGVTGDSFVTGAKSLLVNTGRFVVGDADVGSLSIEAGGTVITSPGASGLPGAVIASTAGASGSSVNVTGAGSEWQIGGSLDVGDAGTGLLSISNGASVTATTLDAGLLAGAAGIVSVSGLNSDLTATGTVSIGDAGSGELSILAGGNANIDGDLEIADAGTGSGNVDIESTTGTIFFGGNINVGYNGIGVLTIGPNVTWIQDNGGINTGANATVTQDSLPDPSPYLNNSSPNYNFNVSGTAEYAAYVGNTGNIFIGAGHSLTVESPTIYGSGGAFSLNSSADLTVDADSVTGQTFSLSGDNTLWIGHDVLPTIKTPASGTGPFTSEPNPNLGQLTVGGFTSTIANFAVGDTIIVDTSAPATFVRSGAMISVIENATTLGVLTFDTAANAATAAGTPLALVDHVLCFLAGTMIATPSGQTEVERLAVGDVVVTAGGRRRPVTWIGQGRVLATRGRRNAATPVIVRKGALGPNVPHKDLRVTKGHALYLDGVLIPVEFLVNHRSILWDDQAQEVALYHIELETHDVLLANGAPAESYRDDGNRWLFQNANSGWDQQVKAPYARVVTGGTLVDEVWRRLLERAGPRRQAPLTDDPDLHLRVDGRRVDAATRMGDAHVFRLGGRADRVQIVSRCGAPQELGLSNDPRCLGAAVRRVAVRQGTRFRAIEASDPRLADGFHAFERGEGVCWTNGDAAVPAALFEGFDGPIELVLHLGGTTRYVDDGVKAEVA